MERRWKREREMQTDRQTDRHADIQESREMRLEHGEKVEETETGWRE